MISSNIFGKALVLNHLSIKTKGTNSSSQPAPAKKLWTKKEDQLLEELAMGKDSWESIAEKINATGGLDKSADQCKERWLKYLEPRKIPSTDDVFILEMMTKFGEDWAEKAAEISGRSVNSLKYQHQQMTKKSPSNFLGMMLAKKVNQVISVNDGDKITLTTPVVSSHSEKTGKESEDSYSHSVMAEYPSGQRLSVLLRQYK